MKFTWTAAALNTLRKLWDEGASVRHISRQLGTTPDSVSSKRRREQLTPRPSPIMVNLFAEALSTHGDIHLASKQCAITPEEGQEIFAKICKDLGTQAR